MDMIKKLDEFVYDILFHTRQMSFEERIAYFEEKMKDIVDSGQYKRLDIIESMYREGYCLKNEDDIDVIYEYITVLIGDCAPSGIAQ